jgi:hypothetical protein
MYERTCFEGKQELNRILDLNFGLFLQELNTDRDFFDESFKSLSREEAIEKEAFALLRSTPHRLMYEE